MKNINKFILPMLLCAYLGISPSYASASATGDSIKTKAGVVSLKFYSDGGFSGVGEIKIKGKIIYKSEFEREPHLLGPYQINDKEVVVISSLSGGSSLYYTDNIFIEFDKNGNATTPKYIGKDGKPSEENSFSCPGENIDVVADGDRLYADCSTYQGRKRWSSYLIYKNGEIREERSLKKR